MYPAPEKADPVAWDKATFKDETKGRNFNYKTQNGEVNVNDAA